MVRTASSQAVAVVAHCATRLMAVVLLAGCAAPLARHPLASNVDKAVEAAAADKGFPNAAEAGLANIDGDTSRS